MIKGLSNSKKLNFVVGSCRLGSILPTEESILDVGGRSQVTVGSTEYLVVRRP